MARAFTEAVITRQGVMLIHMIPSLHLQLSCWADPPLHHTQSYKIRCNIITVEIIVRSVDLTYRLLPECFVEGR